MFEAVFSCFVLKVLSLSCFCLTVFSKYLLLLGLVACVYSRFIALLTFSRVLFFFHRFLSFPRFSMACLWFLGFGDSQTPPI